MKKILSFLIALILVASPAFASHNPSSSPTYLCTKATSDTLIKGSHGQVAYLHIAQDDAAPTAGTIVLYNSITEANTQIWEWTLTTAVFAPFTVPLHVKMDTGIYLGFTTTADVNVTVCYQ